MALSYNPRRRLPLLKTPRSLFDKPELLTSSNNSSNYSINQNWLTRPRTMNNSYYGSTRTMSNSYYAPTFTHEDFPPLDYNILQNRTLTAQRLYTEPSYHLKNNNFNSSTCNNSRPTRNNQRINLQLGDFLLPALQTTSHPVSYTTVNRTSRRPTPTRASFTSSNPDFPILTQNIFRMGQLTHHMKNWEILPSTISTRIDDLVQDIHPPLSKEELTAELSQHAKDFGNKIKETINQHLISELINTTNVLNKLNPCDVKDACKLACTRLKTRLGNKFYRHSLKFTEFEKEVGKFLNNNVSNDVSTDITDNSSDVINCELINNDVNVVSETPVSATDNAVNVVCETSISTTDTLVSITSNTVSKDDTPTVMETTDNVSDVTINELIVSLVSSNETHPKLLFNVPVANKFDVLSVPSVDDDDTQTVSDSQPVICVLATPSRKRQRCNYSPETTHVPKRNDTRRSTNASTLPMILSTTSCTIALDKTNVNCLDLAKPEDPILVKLNCKPTVSNCKPIIINSESQLILSNSVDNISPNISLSQSLICETAVDTVNIRNRLKIERT